MAKNKFKRVTRKFLTDLANKIYNPKNKKYLNLCRGTLQNGPDPLDKKRPMHCGLGELYFEITGIQPNAFDISEADVIDIAVDNSVLGKQSKKEIESIIQFIKKSNISNEMKDFLINGIDETETELEYDDGRSAVCTEIESKFRNILANIPTENDDVIDDGNEYCEPSTYKERSKRVAKCLREAARLLPE